MCRPACADLAIGATGDDDSGTNYGAVYVLFLEPSGTVRAWQKISQVEGGLIGPLGEEGLFGSSLGFLPGSMDAYGVPVMVVGAPRNDNSVGGSGSSNWGEVFLLHLAAALPPPPLSPAPPSLPTRTKPQQLLVQNWANKPTNDSFYLDGLFPKSCHSQRMPW